MDQKIRNEFKEVIKAVLEVEGIEPTPEMPYSVTFPRTLFMVSLSALKKKRITDKDYQDLWNEFPVILRELNVGIRGEFSANSARGDKKKVNLSSQTMKEARKREHYFRKQLGSDY